MAFIKCSGCSEIIDIPDELAWMESADGELTVGVEPYYCDACERVASAAADIDTTEYCPHCGKALEDFSDLGCGHCDRRSPEWGIL